MAHSCEISKHQEDIFEAFKRVKKKRLPTVIKKMRIRLASDFSEILNAPPKKKQYKKMRITSELENQQNSRIH